MCLCGVGWVGWRVLVDGLAAKSTKASALHDFYPDSIPLSPTLQPPPLATTATTAQQ